MSANTEGFDHEARFKFDIEHAVKSIVAVGRLMPLFVLHSPEEMPVIGAPIGPETNKGQMYNVIRLIAIAQDAFAASVIMEAWALRDQAQAPPDPLPRLAEPTRRFAARFALAGAKARHATGNR